MRPEIGAETGLPSDGNIGLCRARMSFAFSTRRRFLQSSLAATAALSLPARLRAATEGANGDIRVAIVGFNGRGGDHIKNFTGIKGVRLVALCDVDAKVLERGAAQLKNKNLDVQTFQDYRKLLESKEVDVISIATPNHWHALGAIWAIQAGNWSKLAPTSPLKTSVLTITASAGAVR